MKISFLLRVLRLREKLWAKPLLYCVAAVLAAMAAHGSDYMGLSAHVPEISQETTEKLLTIISTTMLAVATFAVGSMISAYSSASGSATPRAFALVLADDVSQVALSSFIGAFIFSIVALIALKTGYYDKTGSFALFVMTLAIFAWVVITFVRWVDNIARLGRLGNTIDRVEAATRDCMSRYLATPLLGGHDRAEAPIEPGEAVYDTRIGYVQHINMETLQEIADDLGTSILIDALPGTFVAPGRAMMHVEQGTQALSDADAKRLRKTFVIGNERAFDDDPRFGLIVLSEIASRALSPAVNDPGTAIVIIGRFVRLLSQWIDGPTGDEDDELLFDRIYVPAIPLSEMFDDAFSTVMRDGAGMLEVGIRLQKAMISLSALPGSQAKQEARHASQRAIDWAETALVLPSELERLRELARPHQRDAD